MIIKTIYFFLLSILTVELSACASTSDYIKTRHYQYLRSQNLPSLKLPEGLELASSDSLVIPFVANPHCTYHQIPDLQPPIN